MIALECTDIKCPVHGQLKTHGREIEAVVVSAKARKTAIVEHAYSIFLHKYERSLRKNSRIAAYNPDCIGALMGDRVTIVETRRLSKTKSYAITNVLKRAGAQQ